MDNWIAPPALSVASVSLNLSLSLVMSLLVAWYYEHYGQSLSNRRKFAGLLPVLTVTTALVITIVKSSLALSLGLVGALRETTHPYEQQGLAIKFAVPQTLPDLPAAVEVAAYRITQEAITNVARHAGARNCQVGLEVVHGQLEIEIRDDGHGLPPGYQPGVGLLSMRECAAELNGRCRVESPAGGGTRVFVQLPL